MRHHWLVKLLFPRITIMATLQDLSTKLDIIAKNVAGLKAEIASLQTQVPDQDTIDSLNAKADAIVTAAQQTS